MGGEAVLREVELTLPMAEDMELSASKTATSVAESMQMSPDKIDEVRMAVVEAFINACEHSHATDRRVHLTFSVLGVGEEDPQVLRIALQDHGEGFDPDDLEVPDIRERIASKKKRGWGIQIIRGLMDSVEIDSDQGGTTIIMRKAR